MLRSGVLRHFVAMAIFAFLGNNIAYSSIDPEIQEALTDISDKLDVLTSGQNEQRRKLDVLLAQAGRNRSHGPGTSGQAESETVMGTVGPTEVTGVAEEERETTSFSYNNAFKVVSVERNPTPDGNRFTVRINKTKDVVFRIYDYIGPERVPDTIESEGGGVLAASFICRDNPSSDLLPYLLISDVDLDLMVALQLDNSNSSPAVQSVVHQPVVAFSPAGEAVYTPGQDVNVTAISPVDSETGNVVTYIDAYFGGVDLETGKFESFMYSDDVIKTYNRSGTEERYKVELSVQTSKRRVSGYLQLTADAIDTGGSLVQSLQVSRQKLVRPANQSGPYPTGYLSFAESPHQETSKTGNELIRCSMGHNCSLSCYGIGESVTSIRVDQVLPGGSLAGVPSAEVSPAFMDTVRSVYWTVQATEDFGDSDGITTFKCSVYDTNNFSMVTKLVDAQATFEGTIDPERSNVTVERDETDLDTRNVIFNCAIRGRPLPDVAFYGGTSSEFSFYNEGPDSVIPTGRDEAVATKVGSIHAYGLALLRDEILAGQQTAPYCSIFSPTLGNFTQYDFEIPDVYGQWH